MENANVSIKPRKISPDEIREILSLDRKSITATKLKDLFANKPTQNARFQPNDTFMLPINTFYNKQSLQTTVGRYIFNIFCIPVPYLKKYGYCNDTMSSDGLKDIESKMGQMVMLDEMTTKEYAEYMDNAEWIGMSTAYYISPPIDNDIVLPLDAVMKRKDELFTQYNAELARGDSNIVNKVEKELVGIAKDEITKKNAPSYDLYGSGEFNFNNNYKKCSIMVGTISDPVDGHLSTVKSNYIDGVLPDEYDTTAKLTVIGGASRGVATRKYGYETKKFNSNLQNAIIDIDQEHIDCGTTGYLKITIPSSLKNMFYYRFVIDGNELVELTPDNISKYLDKEVKLRSPMFCKNDVICEHCAGTLFRRMNIRYAGMIASNLTGNMLNLSMKAMHDTTIKMSKLDPEKFITER